MTADEVPDLLAALRQGDLSLDQVAELFRRRTWASARRPEPRSVEERAEQIDPALPVNGSVDDLTAAFDRGELTWDEYRTLAHAVADAFKTEAGESEPPG